MTKTVLITGCSTGIGRATAKNFADAGWNVAATMRDPEDSDLAFAAHILVSRLDVEDKDSIGSAITEAITKFGKIDVLINNAGYGLHGLFETTPEEEIRRQFDVNLFGLMDVIRALLPHFRGNKSGVIVNVSSGAGVFTLPLLSLYCASKFALEGFSEALSYELLSQNILVKIVEPHGGVTSTRFSERASEERTKNLRIDDYDDFVTKTNNSFAKMVAARTTSSEQVARTIYEAATDASSRLRYLIGDDTRGFIKARAELPDQEYVDFMRSKFTL